MKTELFFINALSNLHVGSGEINYGLVDNLIQRDPVTGLPGVNSSSLKGALREHFENTSPDKRVEVKSIFGSKPKDAAQDRHQGCLRFFDADLVSIPARTTGTPFPFVHVSSKEQLARIRNRSSLFGIDAGFMGIVKKLSESPDGRKANIEDIGSYPTSSTEPFTSILGPRIAIVPDQALQVLCDNNHLPVISRNCLENGQSTNLFYEQVLPRYSRLCTMVMGEDDNEFEAFCQALDGQIVQLGGNATIGYGYCLFTRFNTSNSAQ